MEWVNTMIQIINGVGFPIAACVALGAYVVWDKKERRKQYSEQQTKQEKMFSKLEEAVNSNTTIVRQLLERISK